MICSPPGVRRTPGAGVGHGRYFCKLVRWPGVSRGPQGLWVYSSLPKCFLTHCRGPRDPLPFGPCPKESSSCPHYFYFWSTKGGGGDLAGGAPYHGPLLGYCSPVGSSQLLAVLQGSPPVPCLIPQFTLPARSFKWVNLKGFGKLYLCEWCEKQTSN